MGKTGMTKGFRARAPRLIFEHPLSTAVEIARVALAEGVLSVAADPVTSLATTLTQAHRNGRLPAVEAPAGNGTSGSPYCYMIDTNRLKTSVRVEITLDVSYSATGQRLSDSFSAETGGVRAAFLGVVQQALLSKRIPEPYLTMFFDLDDAHSVLR